MAGTLVWTGKEITSSEITYIILQDIVLSEMSLVLSDRGYLRLCMESKKVLLIKAEDKVEAATELVLVAEIWGDVSQRAHSSI